MDSTQRATNLKRRNRSGERSILQNITLTRRYPQLMEMIKSMPNMVAILNEDRQIVSANSNVIDLLGSGDLTGLLGSRPGEVLTCQHSEERLDGCGTTEACQQCGALMVILAAQMGAVDEKECAIRQITGEAFDLRVKASPLRLEGENFIIFSAQSIEGEKRREVLERTFFHDIVNSAGALQGVADLISVTEDTTEIKELAALVSRLSSELLDEIKTQQELLAAERGELVPEIVYFNSRDLLREIKNFYQQHPAGVDKSINIGGGCADLTINSARTLLFRVMGNMTKNALEATSPGGSITMGCEQDKDHARFWVSNNAAMPHGVKLQIFKRSFSTKGAGRGIGTYSMKMLTERYLKGSVFFCSEEGSGTTFSVRIAMGSDRSDAA